MVMDELFLSLSLVVEELKNPFPPLCPAFDISTKSNNPNTQHL